MNQYFSAVFRQLVLPHSVAITMAAAAFLSFTGPFGTFEALPPALRATYWCAVVVTSVIVVTFIRIAIEHWLSPHGRVTRSLVLAVIVAFTLGPLIYAIAHILTSGYREVSPMWVFMLAAFIVTLFIYFVRACLVSLYSDAHKTPRFVERIGAEDAADIYHVGVDDHYITVHAKSGNHRLLMRFADALLELDELDGFQVHRSHWVARNAVQCVVKEKGRTRIELVDGTCVPVSRAYDPVVSQLLTANRS